MKPTALLVDISRAGIVNRQDLADALKAGRLAGAAMDLCDPLPVSMTDPQSAGQQVTLNVILGKEVPRDVPSEAEVLIECKG